MDGWVDGWVGGWMDGSKSRMQKVDCSGWNHSKKKPITTKPAATKF